MTEQQEETQGLLALYGIAVVANALTGYASGLETRRSLVPVHVMGVLVATASLAGYQE